jgi:hypothetical protein
MAISEEQRALLRLLLSGEDYGSIASLLGTDPAGVRSRARLAADQLGHGEPELRQAVEQRLSELEGGRAPQPAALPSARAGWRLWAPLAGAAAILVVVAVVVIDPFSSDPEPAPRPASGAEEVVEIDLQPVGSSKADGVIHLSRTGDIPTADLDLSGLQPSGADNTYIISLYDSPKRALPLLFQGVGANGRLTGRGTIPASAIPLLRLFDQLDVALVNRRRAVEAVDRAAERGQVPRHLGRSVLRGRLPRGA